MIALAVLALFLPQDEVVVTTSREIIANPWIQKIEATCSDEVLRVDGYGAARPEDAPVVLTVSGSAVTGDAIETLREGLADRSAVYRFQAFCPRDGGFSVRIDRGLAGQDGTVAYHTAAAQVSDGRLTRFDDFEPVEATDFWFR